MRRLPLPAWVIYLALGLALSLVVVSVVWAGGVLPTGALVLDYSLSAMTCAYLLALIHFLDESAAVALARFRPVLTVDDAGYNKLYYQLTTLPARPTLIASALGALYSLLVTIFIDVNPGTAAVPPIISIVDVTFRTLLYALIGAMVYHTLHQLRMVNAIYTKHTRINLFQLGPIYALSSLTARTAIGIGLPTYMWFQVTNLSPLGNSPSDTFETLFLVMVMVATFIWPLLGAHNLLEREKQQLKDEVGRRIEATIAALHTTVDTPMLEHRGWIKETLDGLVTEQGVIDKLRTWPWRTRAGERPRLRVPFANNYLGRPAHSATSGYLECATSLDRLTHSEHLAYNLPDKSNRQASSRSSRLVHTHTASGERCKLRAWTDPSQGSGRTRRGAAR